MIKWPIYVSCIITGLLCGLMVGFIDKIFVGATEQAILFGRVIFALLLSLVMPIIFTLIEDKPKKHEVMK